MYPRLNAPTQSARTAINPSIVRGILSPSFLSDSLTGFYRIGGSQSLRRRTNRLPLWQYHMDSVSQNVCFVQIQVEYEWVSPDFRVWRFFYFLQKYAPSFRTNLTDTVQRDFLPVLCDQIPSVTVYFPALYDFRAPCTAAFSQLFLKIRNAQTGMLQSPSAYILPDSVQFLPLFFREFRLFLYIL